jgi:hypothetical protein
MGKKRRQFSEKTPLGYRVVLTRNRWREILRFKHPVLTGHEAAVRSAICDPDLICASAKDSNVHLFYRSIDEGYVCVVVGGDDPEERFVVTAYFTKSIKRGRRLWTK